MIDEYFAKELVRDQHGPSYWGKLTDEGRQYYIERFNTALKRAEQAKKEAKQKLEDSIPNWPWGYGPNDNCKIEGWKSYFKGRGREDCPFPPARNDLQKGYRYGWDCAWGWACANSQNA